MSRQILITGGFGYIGGRIAQAVSKLPNTHVLLGSRSCREAPDWLFEASVVVTEWDDERSLSSACEGVDTVIHLAAMNEVDAVSDPVCALEMTAVYTARLIEVAKSEGVRRFIYLSTAHVYGVPLSGYIDESTCPRPAHPYATSHRAAEDVVLAAHNAGEMDGIVFRLSNSFGAPTHPDINRWTLLVNDLCRQAVITKQLSLRSVGSQRRDFITLADVGEAIKHFVVLPSNIIGDGIFNVGGAWSPTIFEVASLIADRCEAVLGYRPDIFRPEPKGDEISESLDYCVNKLLRTGFNLSSDHNKEVDDMLMFCRQTFLRELYVDE